MPRSTAAVIENNFVGGLKTEFTGLNFPENSCTETFDCIFSKIGRVTRRKGFDIEDSGVYSTINRSGGVVNTYLWKNVAGDGRIVLLVEQIGNVLRFYEVSDTSTAISNQLLSSSITLSSFLPSGSTVNPASTECQFAQGNGYLFVFHKDLEPFYVVYDTSAQTVTGNTITVQIRDLGGINENTPVAQRPITLTDSHRYNLGNQGWKSRFSMTSSTSLAIGTGSKTFTVNLSNTVSPLVIGDTVFIYSAASAASTNYFLGVVTAYTGTSLTVNVTSVAGSGTLSDWIIHDNPDQILVWNLALNNFPSNADIWWYYKNASDVFAPSTTIANVPVINSPAPKGHYIVDAFNINRSLASGISGLTSLSTGGTRPSVGAFFQGRVFYGGVNYSQYNTNIYFSQTIETTAEQFGNCYQANDPTSDILFDLLPTDGGVISIQGVGTIIKMIALKTALLVFASNGVWAITGNQGIGFTANDYTVVPISDMKTIQSASSFVQVNETIMWWALNGIYTLNASNAQGIQIQNITTTTIDGFYNNIPNSCKLTAKGYYNPISFIVQWVYRSTDTDTIEEKYEFDRILNLNTVTNAFYPWTISDSSIKVNGIVVIESQGGNLEVVNVINDADNVIDESGNQVVIFNFSGNVTSIFKYVISKPNGSSYSMSFGETFKDTYLDWQSLAAGVDYESYLITGYAVHGQAQRFFQSNFVYVYADFDEDDLTQNSYTIQGIWNYANSGNSGDMSSQQRVTVQRADITKEFYDVQKRRFKIRGRGLAVQLKLASSEGLPFSIIGWSKYETANQGI